LFPQPTRFALFAAALGLSLAGAEERLAQGSEDSASRAWSDLRGLADRLLPAESPALKERLTHPERLFLWEGSENVGPGETFYTSPGWARRLMGAGQVDPRETWELLADPMAGDTGRVGLRLRGGSETGDGLYREMQGRSRPEQNRTPYFSADAHAYALPQLRLRALVDQNDVSTYRTFSNRAGLLKPSAPWSDLAYFGENLPTRSYALGEMHFKQRGGVLHAAVARGWHWGLSPVTGSTRPWLVALTRIDAGFDEANGIYLDLAQWETPEEALHDAGQGFASEVGLRLTGGEDDWAWRLMWGYSRRRIEPGRAGGFEPLDVEGFPLTLSAGKRIHPESLGDWAWTTRIQATSRDGLASAQGHSVFGKEKGAHRPEAGLEGFADKRFSGAPIAREYAYDTSETVVGEIRPARLARGLAAHLRYGWQGKQEYAEIKTHFASEWGRPVFFGEVGESAETAAQSSTGGLRQGLYRGSDYVLHNVTATAKAQSVRVRGVYLGVFSGWRAFFGEEAQRLEYEPAPYWAGGNITLDLPTDLQITALVQAVGGKRVRQWGGEAAQPGSAPASFRVAPHFENQVGIRQRFLKNRFAAQLQCLHAFGDEILEHPAGNPLRFRIHFGLEGHW